MAADDRTDPNTRVKGGFRSVNEMYKGVAIARKRWQEGHRKEALTMMLLAHGSLSDLLPRQGKNGEIPGFSLISGLYLAQMSDEVGQDSEAYDLYHRIIHPPLPEQENFELRPDILLSYAELCGRLKRQREAKWAFDQIAKGDAFTTYLSASREASSRSRLDVAERWIRKALELQPSSEIAKKQLKKIQTVRAKGIRSGVG